MVEEESWRIEMRVLLKTRICLENRGIPPIQIPREGGEYFGSGSLVRGCAVCSYRDRSFHCLDLRDHFHRPAAHGWFRVEGKTLQST